MENDFILLEATIVMGQNNLYVEKVCGFLVAAAITIITEGVR